MNMLKLLEEQIEVYKKENPLYVLLAREIECILREIPSKIQLPSVYSPKKDSIVFQWKNDETDLKIILKKNIKFVKIASPYTNSIFKIDFIKGYDCKLRIKDISKFILALYEYAPRIK